MKPEQLTQEFAARGPWVTKFTIGGRPYGGAFDAGEDERLKPLFDELPSDSRILELGSMEGGHTFALARKFREVVAVEGRPENVRRATFVQQALGVDNVRFLSMNLESADLSSLGQFDCVFCFGLLYHLPRPWDLVPKMRAVADRLYMWTHYADEARATATAEGYRGMEYREFGAADVLSGLSPMSFWLGLPDLERLLAAHYREVSRLRLFVNANGPSVLTMARA